MCDFASSGNRCLPGCPNKGLENGKLKLHDGRGGDYHCLLETVRVNCTYELAFAAGQYTFRSTPLQEQSTDVQDIMTGLARQNRADETVSLTNFNDTTHDGLRRSTLARYVLSLGSMNQVAITEWAVPLMCQLDRCKRRDLLFCMDMMLIKYIADHWAEIMTSIGEFKSFGTLHQNDECKWSARHFIHSVEMWPCNKRRQFEDLTHDRFRQWFHYTVCATWAADVVDDYLSKGPVCDLMWMRNSALPFHVWICVETQEHIMKLFVDRAHDNATEQHDILCQLNPAKFIEWIETDETIHDHVHQRVMDLIQKFESGPAQGMFAGRMNTDVYELGQWHKLRADPGWSLPICKALQKKYYKMATARGHGRCDECVQLYEQWEQENNRTLQRRICESRDCQCLANGPGHRHSLPCEQPRGF